VYIDAEVVRRLEASYGRPRELHLAFTMPEREFDLCRRVYRRGRAHDVTLFILKRVEETLPSAEVAVIRKWSYPPDLFRPPSGGVEPGEAFEEGAAREAYEETGLRVALDRYLVRARARFDWQEEAIDWTTHVFSARLLGGSIDPVDRREIEAARWATLHELDTDLRSRMLARESAGFCYRVALHDAALEELGVR
jgi:8-oxo-dGTP pyrophosphatase MutT (NUDIX family)